MSLNETLLPENIVERSVNKAKIVSIDQLRKNAPQTFNRKKSESEHSQLGRLTRSDNVISFEDLQKKRNAAKAIESLSKQTGLGLNDAASVIEAIQKKENGQNLGLFGLISNRPYRFRWILAALGLFVLIAYIF